MAFTVEQIGAVHQATQILEDAGLLTTSSDTTDLSSQLQELLQSYLLSAGEPALVNPHYSSPSPRSFTPAEIASGANRVTGKSYINCVIEHPLGAIVEYPTSCPDTIAVAHRFKIHSGDFVDPTKNIQYSLGDPQGSFENVICHLLCDTETLEPVHCRQTKKGCEFFLFLIYIYCIYSNKILGRGIKICSFAASSTAMIPLLVAPQLDAYCEVVLKTLAFYCAVIEHGCLFQTKEAPEHLVPGDSDELEPDQPEESDDEDGFVNGDTLGTGYHDLYEILRDSRAHDPSDFCRGRLIFLRGIYGQPFIQYMS